MKLIYVTVFLIISLNYDGISQDLFSRKILSYELGKTGLVHSLYFDNKLSNSSYGYRVGVGNNLSGQLFFGKLSIGFYKLMGKKINFLNLD